MSFRYPKHVRFKCEFCTLCCRDTESRVRRILLLNSEANRISDENSIEIEMFAEKIEGFKPYVYQMRKTEDGRCIFLKGNLCSIYPIRPLICRFYPFQLRSIGKNEYIFTYTNECPGIGKGVQLKREFFEKLFRIFMKSMKENIQICP